MRALKRFLMRLLNFSTNRRGDERLREEIESHIEAQTEENLRAGMVPEEARRQARLKFGAVEAIREKYHGEEGLPIIEEILQDMRFALRMLRKSPGSTSVAVLILALGIGVNTSVFTLLDALLFRPLPVPQAQRVLTFFRGENWPCSYPDYLDFRDRAHGFTGLAADLPNEGGVDAHENSEVGQIEGVSYNYADVLGAKALRGRWFSPQDDRVNHGGYLAVISYRVWHILFSDDPGVLGKLVKIDGQPYTIVGVAPRAFLGMNQPMMTDVWVPLNVYARHNEFAAGVVQQRQGKRVLVFGRLRPGVNEAQALAELNAIDGRLQREYPHAGPKPALLRSESVRGISDPRNRRNASELAALLIAVAGMVLLIACANIATLLLAKGQVRRHEISVRMALGAGRMRIVQQAMVESFCLAILGSVAGVGAAIGANRLLESSISAAPLPIAIGTRLTLDKRVLIFVFCASIFTALAFGTLPAIVGSRPDLVHALKREYVVAKRRFRYLSSRNLYVVGQIAISLLLLVISGLFIHALQKANEVEVGFNVSHLLSARVYMPPAQFTDSAAEALMRNLLIQVRAMPSTRSATVSYDSPLISATSCIAPLAKRAELHSEPISSNIVGTNYFATLGVSLLAGRDFSSLDGGNSPRVVIVNDVLRRRYFPGQVAIGKELRIGCSCEHGKCYNAEIVGVAMNAKYSAPDQPAEPYVFLPITQHPARFVSLLIRTRGGPADVQHDLHQRLVAFDPRLRIYDISALSEQIYNSFWLLRWETSLLSGFGTLALLLAAVGLYGIISASVTQRTKEIGIRMALGARRGDVRRLVLASTLGLTAVGLVLGLGSALLITRLLRGYLYGLSPTDPISFAGAALSWFIVALIASYIPLRHATRVDPTITLRYE